MVELPMKPVVCACVLSICVLALATEAFAQRDLEIPIQFDFINPGARSLSLGGAFIGLADDATAAATNPAGLQQLAQPEISIEGRGWRFVTDFVRGGRLTGPSPISASIRSPAPCSATPKRSAACRFSRSSIRADNGASPVIDRKRRDSDPRPEPKAPFSSIRTV